MAKKIRDLHESKLRLLRRASKRRLPARMGPKNPELLACAELVDSGHLDGWVTVDAKGQPIAVLDAQITSAGEEFLEQFEEVAPAPENLHPIRLRLRQLHPRQLFSGFGSLILLITILLTVCKTKETTAHANGKDIGQRLQDVANLHPKTPALKQFWGVCGRPPLE